MLQKKEINIEGKKLKKKLGMLFLKKKCNWETVIIWTVNWFQRSI